MKLRWGEGPNLTRESVQPLCHEAPRSLEAMTTFPRFAGARKVFAMETKFISWVNLPIESSTVPSFYGGIFERPMAFLLR